MEEFEKFSALIEKWKAAYVYAIQSCVGAKTNVGNVLLCGKIQFLTTLPSAQREAFEFDSEHIFAARHIKKLTPKEVSRIIANAKTGRLEIGEKSYALTPDGNGLRFYLPLGDTAFPLNLRVSGKSQSHFLHNNGIPREVAWELKASDTPFDSLDQLFAYCDLPSSSMGNRDTTLEIDVDLPATISDRSTMKDGLATVEYQAARGLDLGKIKLGFQLPISEQIVERSTLGGEAIEWKKEGAFLIGTHSIESKDVPLLHAYLSYDGVPIHQRSIADSNVQLNVRHAAHLSVDPDEELLREALLKPHKNGKAETFEGAVATLLTLLGFSTLSYGVMRGFSDGPDVIAFTPSKKVVVVECTTEGLNHKDKLTKLIRRTKLIRQEFIKADYPDIEIQPVMVTLSKRDEVQSELDEAARLRVSVFTNENLEAALKQTILPKDPDHFFKELGQLIPINQQSSLGYQLGMFSQ